MVEQEDENDLIFFDTFSHDLHEVRIFCLIPLCRNNHYDPFSLQKLNLDLVQFPSPVYISEIRIIPLGARVQADFPGKF